MNAEIELDVIHNKDCVEGMKLLPDGCIDLTVTSPPYDRLRAYEGFNFDFESIAKELFRVTKDGGVLVWVVSDGVVKGSETGTSFKQALYFMGIGFRLHDTMIYKKDSFTYPDPTRYHQNFEYMFILSKGKPMNISLIADKRNKYADGKKCITGRDRQADGSLTSRRKGNLMRPYGVRFNVWEYGTGKNKTTKDDIAFEHPAIFPEKLCQDHIISWSSEGEIVLDPFMGSGTTAKMAMLLNRHYIGFEISEKYCEIARKRLAEHKAQVNMFSDKEAPHAAD